MKRTTTYLALFLIVFFAGIIKLKGQAVLYGTIAWGGPANAGVLFEWNPATDTYTIIHDFSNSVNGSSPNSSLVLYEGKIYGTAGGGTSNSGVIFEWDPATSTYSKKYDFGGSNGIGPGGILTLNDGKFYGTTYGGGASGNGVIYEWDPVTNIYTKKYDFDGTNGDSPCGYMTFCGGKFYGMTFYGGANYYGVIFEWDPTTNLYTKKYDFSEGIDGYAQLGSLTLSAGKLYGTAQGGGPSDYGVIFEFDPATGTYTRKYDFDGTNGSWPNGFLTLYDGSLYGAASMDGPSDYGVIFEFDPVTDTYTKKYDFDGTNGGNASSGLTLSNGKFYSMTAQGGTAGFGVLFEWDPATNIYTKEFDLSTSTGYLPNGTYLLEYTPPGVDADGDGYTTEEGDCNDNDPSVNPGATEICNGVDDNCNGLIDEDVQTVFYADSDGDGYGDPDVTIMGCSAPDGFVDNSGDCDDNNATVNPGAEEVCNNNIDDNCNGQIDEGCCDITVDAGEDITSYFGILSMQQVDRTAVVSGGTPPFSYSWTLDRPLLCDQANDDGDEEFYGGSCTDNICPADGNPVVDPVCTGSASITAVLMDTALVCVTVTDANGCTASDCFELNASDVRCFAGNGGVHKIKMCHHSNNPNHPWVEICVDTNAIESHLAHGDYMGSCQLTLMMGLEEEGYGPNFTLYPNPTDRSVSIAFIGYGEYPYKIEIVDMTGRKLNSYQGRSVPGENSRVLNLEDIVPGIYTVTLTINGNKELRKLLVR